MTDFEKLLNTREITILVDALEKTAGAIAKRDIENTMKYREPVPESKKERESDVYYQDETIIPFTDVIATIAPLSKSAKRLFRIDLNFMYDDKLGTSYYAYKDHDKIRIGGSGSFLLDTPDVHKYYSLSGTAKYKIAHEITDLFKEAVKIIDKSYKDRVTESKNLIANYSQVPKYLYHATLYEYLDDIQQYGLGGTDKHKSNSTYDDIYQGNGIFLSYDPEDAAMYLSDYDSEDVVVLQVPKRILDKNQIYYDTNNEDNIDNPTTWYYKGVIKNPQANVKIVDY